MSEEAVMEERMEESVAAEARPLAMDEFEKLLEKEFRPRSDDAKTRIESAVQTLAQQLLQDSGAAIASEPVNAIKALIAEIDNKLTDQLNQILHHPEFQQLESAWRGLHHLVTNTETDEMLKIRVLNVGKKELSKTIKKFPGASWDQSPLFKKIYGEEYDILGGEPYGCLIGDYYFDNSPVDVEILKGMAQIASAAHAPFIAAAAPELLQMESWSELPNPRDLAKIMSTPDYAAWRSLREMRDACYVGLAMPRFLARLPYGAKTEPVEAFAFEEDTESADTKNYCWANSAYAMAVNINRAFKENGWCTQIRGVESGGIVLNLPVHTFPTDDGGVDMKCPTEIAIGDRREAELAKLGLMPLLHRKNTDVAAFIGAQSLHKPQEFDDPDATANANLSARLPYLFATTRFAHYLKCIVRDKIGKLTSREKMHQELHRWIMNYVCGNPDTASPRTLAEKPLSAASVEIEDVEGNPGYYNAVFHLKPHYQLEGVKVSLRLISKLPSEKQ